MMCVQRELIYQPMNLTYQQVCDVDSGVGEVQAMIWFCSRYLGVCENVSMMIAEEADEKYEKTVI